MASWMERVSSFGSRTRGLEPREAAHRLDLGGGAGHQLGMGLELGVGVAEVEERDTTHGLDSWLVWYGRPAAGGDRAGAGEEERGDAVDGLRTLGILRTDPATG